MTSFTSDFSYRAHVESLEKKLNTDKALSQAVGGEFVAIGKLEYSLLRNLGLKSGHAVIDIGCGSGRLACQLAPFRDISYIGCDVVPRLLEYAKTLCDRPDWQFHSTNGTSIPCASGSAHFACFFSVFTHLTHEDTYRYIMEAHRVLVPGGLLVMSFLEFRVPSHWVQFKASVFNLRPDNHLNQFLSRDAIDAWAHHAGFEVVSIHDGDSNYISLESDVVFDDGRVISGAGSLGQSLAVLRKPLQDLPDGSGGSSIVPEYLYLDAPAEGSRINPKNLYIEGWLWCKEAQKNIERIQLFANGRLMAEVSQLVAREDVSNFLGVPADTPTVFRATIEDDSIGEGRLVELQLSVCFRDGRTYQSPIKRSIRTMRPGEMQAFP